MFVSDLRPYHESTSFLPFSEEIKESKEENRLSTDSNRKSFGSLRREIVLIPP